MVRSREVSQPRDLCLELCDRSEIWYAPGSDAVEGPVKFQSDAMIRTTNLAASSFHEILRQNVLWYIETEPRGPWIRH